MPDLGAVTGHTGIAAAIVAVAGIVTTFWLALAATIWRVSLEPQRRRDATRCAEDLRILRERIMYLEFTLWSHSTGALRQDMQLAVSELHMDVAKQRKEASE